MSTPGLNTMPPEIILQIFYQLCFVITKEKGHNWMTLPSGATSLDELDAAGWKEISPDRVTIMAQLNKTAMVSKYVYQCFKDSEFDIFRRLVLRGHDHAPGFADLVIKIGSLKFMENRPTDPEKIAEILRGVTRYYRTSPVYPDSRPELRVELHPKHYDGVLDWLAGRFRRHTYDNDRERRRGQTVFRGPGIPDATFVEHPFDVLYPATNLVPMNEWVGFYLRTLHKEVETWKKHLDTKYWVEEDSYFYGERREGDPPFRPCCLAKDCPRHQSLQWMRDWSAKCRKYTKF
ncbi:hypothetical protein CONLIGDRAFT_668349 [Coniochaeta ligniaria NRRL 30616]|uniref:Uncharacterized protein n=1 Tax=Coniochaeta ligniaria NRRL 30616 TaxID=1408157 RepID=A0A1J7JY14_9PEZI|nr:hypothetical protein CONLIGDRAFT_668349 [Coniochaeta ligniaria NRRL 30616]